MPLLTLTDPDTKYKITDLLLAADSKLTSLWNEITITSDPDNTDPIKVGGADLDATHYERILEVGDSYTERKAPSGDVISTNRIYVISTGAGQKLQFSGREW